MATLADTDLPFLSMAADIGGAAAARPFHEVAKASFTTIVDSELVATQVRLGATLKALGRDHEAADEWAKALRFDPANFVLRKQIWLLRFPERFHPTIDFTWQKEQLAREHAEEEAWRRKNFEGDSCSLS